MRLRAWIVLVALAGSSAAAFADYMAPAELERLVSGKGGPYILVDVRTPEEYAEGYIPTAVNIPVDVISERFPTEDKAALVVVYCRSGHRSGIAKKTLDGLGYTHVVDFGALGRWEGALTEPAPDGAEGSQ